MAKKAAEEKEKEEVLDVEAMEKSFNDAVEDLKKAIGDSEEVDPKPGKKDLKKAKGKKAPDFEEEEEEEPEEEEEEDEEEAKGVKKSVEDILSEDSEAEASMDVEPFLRQLAKAIDKRLDGIEALSKAQGRAIVMQSELSKAQSDLVKEQADAVQKIAQQDQKTQGILRLQKSRFEQPEGDPVELSGPAILEKSMDWLKNEKIDLLEAGMIETRINKGQLGKRKDTLDRKVAQLIKEAS